MTEENTTTLYMPFQRHVMHQETGYDTTIITVPSELVTTEGGPGADPELAVVLLRITTHLAQGMRCNIRVAEWWVTRDVAVVEQRAPGDRCPTCLAGLDQALAAMRDQPGLVVAVGRLSWCG